jgi:septum formation protein
MDGVKIILASGSPRRRELLAQIGLNFEVRVSNVEEKVTATDPGAVVEALSAQKAEAVFAEIVSQRAEGMSMEPAYRTEDAKVSGSEGLLVIGADTVVAVDGRILGKPSQKEEAREMLEMLSGRSHEVYTGITLIYGAQTEAIPGHGSGNTGRKTFHETTSVSFYPMWKQEIDSYIASGDCMDKAGAYGIQGIFARYVRKIEGDYNNVVGLPVGRLYQEMKEWIQI